MLVLTWGTWHKSERDDWGKTVFLRGSSVVALLKPYLCRCNRGYQDSLGSHNLPPSTCHHRYTPALICHRTLALSSSPPPRGSHGWCIALLGKQSHDHLWPYLDMQKQFSWQSCSHVYLWPHLMKLQNDHNSSSSNVTSAFCNSHVLCHLVIFLHHLACSVVQWKILIIFQFTLWTDL